MQDKTAVVQCMAAQEAGVVEALFVLLLVLRAVQVDQIDIQAGAAERVALLVQTERRELQILMEAVLAAEEAAEGQRREEVEMVELQPEEEAVEEGSLVEEQEILVLVEMVEVAV
jgi:hypothetical protein